MTNLVLKKSKRSPEIVEVGSPETDSIDLPKKGCLEVAAKIEIDDYRVNIPTNASFSRAKLTIVTMFLRHRLNKPKLTEQDVQAEIEDAGLLDAIYEFYENEANRWKPTGANLEVKGRDAMAIALAHAEKISGVACKRADLPEVFVYQTLTEVPLGCEVIQSFCDAEEVAEVSTGKGEIQTGTQSITSSDDTTESQSKSLATV